MSIFSKMLSIFKKSEKKEERVGEVASLLFSIDKHGEIEVGANLVDESDETIHLLSELVYTLGTEACFESIIDILRTGFYEADQKDQFEVFLKIIFNNYINDLNQEKLLSEEPVVKPSQVISEDGV